MHDFRQLKVWKKSRLLVVEIFKITKPFPREEKFGLVSQMRRSSISIASNIAEGCGRNSQKDFNRFLDMALGSAFELETQLLISSDLGLIDTLQNEVCLSSINEVSKMIVRLKNKIN